MSAGWSKAGARRMGVLRPDYAPAEPCFYCGVPGCEECSAPLAPDLVGDVVLSPLTSEEADEERCL